MFAFKCTWVVVWSLDNVWKKKKVMTLVFDQVHEYVLIDSGFYTHHKCFLSFTHHLCIENVSWNIYILLMWLLFGLRNKKWQAVVYVKSISILIALIAPELLFGHLIMPEKKNTKKWLPYYLTKCMNICYKLHWIIVEVMTLINF